MYLQVAQVLHIFDRQPDSAHFVSNSQVTVSKQPSKVINLKFNIGKKKIVQIIFAIVLINKDLSRFVGHIYEDLPKYNYHIKIVLNKTYKCHVHCTIKRYNMF